MRKGGVLSYLLADHLGSTTAVLDTSGDVVSSRKYWAYGAERSLSGDARATDQWYTGQRDEDFDGLGLYNYKARFYSTVTGRFVSADPIVAGGLNRYSYVLNNPMAYTDPSGLCPADQCLPTPAATPGPTPEVDACDANFLACLSFSLALKYGTADAGLAIVMGFRQSYANYMEYSGYVGLFWDRFKPSCGGNAMADCFSELGKLLAAGGVQQALSIFGILMIETYPTQIDLPGIGGVPPLEGLAARVVSHRLKGYDTLDAAMTSGGIPIKAVIGFSSGAATVSQWYADNGRARTPFFLIEPYIFAEVLGRPFPDIDFVDPSGHSAYRSSFPLNSCGGGGHCTHNAQALQVMHSLMPDRYR